MRKTDNRFLDHILLEVLLEHLNPDHPVHGGLDVIVAYSGGCDSQVLLHLLSRLRDRININIIAAHFDHGLHSESRRWAESCHRWSRSLGVDFRSTRQPVKKTPGENLEAKARTCRYRWLDSISRSLTVGERSRQIVITAHHADDQVETFLLHLFQGKSLHQLAGIAESRALIWGSRTRLIRPFLSVFKQQIKDYALEHQLDWIEDPANQSTDYYRNYLRHQLVPVLYRRNPLIKKKIVSAAQACVRASHWHQQFLSRIVDSQLQPEKKTVFCLATPFFVDSSVQDLKNNLIDVIRFWLHESGYSAPSISQLKSLEGQIMGKYNSHRSSQAEIEYKGQTVRYYNHHLYLLPKINLEGKNFFQQRMDWNMRPVFIDRLNLKITVDTSIDFTAFDNKILSGQNWSLCWRQGGEKIILPGRDRRASVKKLFQSARVPPWERDWLPYLKNNDEIFWLHKIGPSRGLIDEFGKNYIRLKFSSYHD